MNKFSQTQRAINDLEGMMPGVLDNIDTILSINSLDTEDFKLKAHLIVDFATLKEDLIELLAFKKAKMNKIANDFILEQEGMAQDVR